MDENGKLHGICSQMSVGCNFMYEAGRVGV